jgi:hypothetical protein
VAVLAALVALAGLAPTAPAATAAAPSDPTVEVIVKVEPGATSHLGDAQVAAAAFGREAAVVTEPIAPGTYLVRAQGSDARAVARAVARRPGVAYAEPNAVYRAFAPPVPDDPCYEGCAQGDQWYLRTVGAPRAWATSRGSSRVVVAVLDSAVKRHPDLAQKLTVGPDYSDPNDSCGSPTVVDHGTHVAGIVGARTDNATGVAGIGWNTRVLGVGVLNANGCGSTASIVQGLRYAISRRVRIVNLSLGGPPSAAIKDAVDDARRRGVLVVAAAGNSGWTFPEYPAAYEGVLAVAATNRNGRIAPFSNRGSWVDVAAPGAGILSTTFQGSTATYEELDGTSFAAPLVAGTAALLAAENPCMSADDLARRITTTARPLSGVTDGRLDAGAALTPPARGFRFASASGGVFTRAQCFYGSAAGVPLQSPIVGMAPTPTDRGYWLVAADGGVFSFGDARFFGSAATLPLTRPIVAMHSTPTGRGYWLVASDGGVFSYGDARFFGSTGAIRLTRPVLGMDATPSGRGYWLVASDGGVFAFGDARFRGSTGAIRLVSPVRGMTASPSGNGYLLVAGDGGVFAFGDARFRGAAGGGRAEATGIAATHSGRGYWVLRADGSVRSFGDATPYPGVRVFGAVAITAATRG